MAKVSSLPRNRHKCATCEIHESETERDLFKLYSTFTFMLIANYEILAARARSTVITMDHASISITQRLFCGT